MASHHAHHVTGIAAGLIAAALVHQAGAAGPLHVWSGLAALMGIIGGTAPDWLEVAWWSRKRKLWIAHRSWMHWGIGWCGLLIGSYLALGRIDWAPLPFGFAAGGVMHLLADWPNPMGVPWIIERRSLHLWKSGRCDLIVIALAWAAAFVVCDGVFFDSEHLHRLTALAHGVRVVHGRA
jgi:membrane-bound metal-dependent hydrolase YbcI (DUF457 family)